MLRRNKTSCRLGKRVSSPSVLTSPVQIVLAALFLCFGTFAYSQEQSVLSPAPSQRQGQTQGLDQPKPQPAKQDDGSQDYKLQIETSLVVLHATVSDKDSRPIADLKQDDFKVFENNVEQKIKVFKREDIPVSVGLVVDNSGSMRDKRRGVNSAALKFVRSSNEKDEVFLVNFNEESFLDTDFTDSVPLLEEGLEKIDARGGTALYDALDMSLQHITESASLDKRVLILITDGEDDASKITLEQLIQNVEHANVMIYTVGLLSGESGHGTRRAKRALQEIS